MIPFATSGPELYVALAAIATAIISAIATMVKLGPERQVMLVSAQDTVIDNLREEVERQRAEHQIALNEMESRHRRQIGDLEDQLAKEAETCERRIAELQKRLGVIEKRSQGRRTR